MLNYTLTKNLCYILQKKLSVPKFWLIIFIWPVLHIPLSTPPAPDELLLSLLASPATEGGHPLRHAVTGLMGSRIQTLLQMSPLQKSDWIYDLFSLSQTQILITVSNRVEACTRPSSPTSHHRLVVWVVARCALLLLPPDMPDHIPLARGCAISVSRNLYMFFGICAKVKVVVHFVVVEMVVVVVVMFEDCFDNIFYDGFNKQNLKFGKILQ